MNTTQKSCLQEVQKIAGALKTEFSAPSLRMYVPRTGINNYWAWERFLPIAELASGNKIENEFYKGVCTLTANEIKLGLFSDELISMGDNLDVFADMCQNDYWLWSLVEASAVAALGSNRFPIDAQSIVDAIDSLRENVPPVRFATLATTLVRTLGDAHSNSDLASRFEFVPPSMYFCREAENKQRPSLEQILRSHITKEGFLEFLEDGVVLIDDPFDTDPKTATIKFNKLFLLDWQLGQVGPTFINREGLKAKP